MISAWRVLDFTQFSGDIRSVRGGISVRRQDEDDIRVPLEDVAVVVIGYNATLSGAVLEKFSRYDVALLVADWRGVPVSAAIPWTQTSRVAARINAQAQLALPKKKRAWKAIIRAKVLGQAANLVGKDKKHLTELASGIKSGDLANVEAAAANYYWRRVFCSRADLFNRSADSDDGINACLNYGYAILRGRCIRALAQAGLSPTLGIFHHNRGNFYALADDLIEPFRPAVDWAVKKSDMELDPEIPETKHQLVSVLERPMDKQGRSVQASIDLLAARLGQYVESQVEQLEVPVWKAKANV